MANTYYQIYMHIVFAVHNRETLIKDELRDELFSMLEKAGVEYNPDYIMKGFV